MSLAIPDPEKLIEALAAQKRGVVSAEAGLDAIHTGGVWVAERLHRALGSKVPLGTLAVTLHRDDFGRPRAVRLAMLADRGGRELPVAPDYLGAKVDVGDDEELVLSSENGKLRLAAVKRP